MVCSKINVLNLQKFVPRELLRFVKTERFLPLLVRALFFNKPSRKSAGGRKLRWHQSATDKAAINITL